MRILLLSLTLVWLQACSTSQIEPPGIGSAIDWDAVPGWHEDELSQAWPALLNSCKALSNHVQWSEPCATAQNLRSPDTARVKAFFERWFKPHLLHGEGGATSGLITGYYEPLLQGSLTPSTRYPYPLYGRPESLLSLDFQMQHPDTNLGNWRGRLQGNKVVPYFSRDEIESSDRPLAGGEILWVNNRDDAFFLHVQGSGRVVLESGDMVALGYSDNNGHPYVSVGKLLIERGEIEPEDVSLFSIRNWLDEHPDAAKDLLNENPRYIFFARRDNPQTNPVGSLNVPLTPMRSIAIDPKVVPLGTPVWLNTNYPGAPESVLRQLVMAQDTGAAIEGNIRADVFWGEGPQAEQAAGIMKERGTMLVFLPR